jgi:nucleoside-triphosphatase THEP1
MILSGKVGSGKTSSLRSLAEAATAEGYRVAAVLQRDKDRGPDGIGLGFSMECLSGEQFTLYSESMDLAREKQSEDIPSADMILHGHFAFDAAAFSNALTFISAALDGVECPALIGLDEIGKLELERGEGLRACLDAALAAGSRADGPRLLVLTARSLNVPEIRRLVEASGFRTAEFHAEDQEAFLNAALAAL